MAKTITEKMVDVHVALSNKGEKKAAEVVWKANHHMTMARYSLRDFINERELSPDAVEDLEDIIKCLE